MDQQIGLDGELVELQDVPGTAEWYAAKGEQMAEVLKKPKVWGGARAGSGPRKQQTSATTVLSVRIPRNELVEIDRLAKKNQLTRNDFVLRELRRRIHKSTPR